MAGGEILHAMGYLLIGKFLARNTVHRYSNRFGGADWRIINRHDKVAVNDAA